MALEKKDYVVIFVTIQSRSVRVNFKSFQQNIWESDGKFILYKSSSGSKGLGLHK